MTETVAAYFDYLCPYAWRGAEVAAMVATPLSLRFDWHPFSLVQAHHRRAGDGWQLWNAQIDADDGHGAHGLQPFLAGCAAQRQGPDCFDRFHLALLRARHVEGLPLTRPTVLRVAEGAGLQLARFERDLGDPELRTSLAHEHYRAALLDVVDSPTFAFREGPIASFRVRGLPRDEAEAVGLFVAFRDLLERYPYLETVRRPAPKGN